LSQQDIPMTDSDLCYLSATEALRHFAARKVSPTELVEAYLDQAAATAESCNAFSFIYAQDALAAARASEQRYASGNARPLEGLPTAVKDENMIKGRVTTFGSLLYRDTVATSTTPVVQRLIDAGVVVHGRTTTPEFSCTGFTHSRLWGVTRNPWNPAYTPGGSSGGSGAALAGGMASLATGSDIGGSIRIPASACGVVGYKPPYGRNPSTPPFNLDFYNHPGPMARTVEDCLLMQNVMCGPHPKDVASLRPKLELKPDHGGIKGWKVAWSLDLGYYELDEDVRRNTMAALEVFHDLGAELVEVDVGWTQQSEKAANNYLATLFGTWISEYLDDRASQLTDYARAFGEMSQSVTKQDFLASLYTVGTMYDTFGPIMEDCNVFICPTLAVPAVPADFNPLDGYSINGKPVDPFNGWVMTYPFNMLSRCPVLSVPSGKAANNVPTGIQIVGRTYSDADVFRAGLAYEKAIGGWYTKRETRPSLSGDRT